VDRPYGAAARLDEGYRLTGAATHAHPVRPLGPVVHECDTAQAERCHEVVLTDVAEPAIRLIGEETDRGIAGGEVRAGAGTPERRPSPLRRPGGGRMPADDVRKRIGPQGERGDGRPVGHAAAAPVEG
jgi:hypothetical protein